MGAGFEQTFWNPVLRKELLTGLRAPRLRWILLLYTLVPFAAVAYSWPTGAPYYGGGDLAIRVWKSFMLTQAALVALLTPVFAAYTVSSEFEQHTAEFLWTTLISPTTIILSKMAAVLALCIALLVASLPALSLIFFLGGVDVGEMLVGFCFLLLVACFATAAATHYSATFRKGHLALFCTYLTFAGMGFFLMCSAGIPGGNLLVPTVVLLIPTIVFILLTGSTALKPIGEMATPNIKPIDDPREIARRRRGIPDNLVDPELRLPPIPDHANVVAVQELRIHPMHRSEWGARCSYVLLLPSVFFLLPSFGDTRLGDTFQSGFWWLNFVLAGGWVIVVHSVSMTMDQEMETLESLRLTGIGSHELLWGKWLASLKRRWVMIVCGIVIVDWLYASEKGHRGALLLALCWWLGVELLGLLGFAVGSFCSKTMVAVALSLGVLGMVVFCAGWPVGGLLEMSPVTHALIVLSAVALGALLWLLARIGARRKWRRER